jgi:hypothetical protein
LTIFKSYAILPRYDEKSSNKQQFIKNSIAGGLKTQRRKTMKNYSIELGLKSSSFEGIMRVTISVNRPDGVSLDDAVEEEFLNFREKNLQFENLEKVYCSMPFDKYMGWDDSE